MPVRLLALHAPYQCRHRGVCCREPWAIPVDRVRHRRVVDAVNAGRKVLPHDFEEPRYFESCMPIEVMAERGPQTLRFGPMRPIGLRDPRTGHRPWAVVQLRPENRYLTAYNLVGFQTRLAYPEQQRIFQMVPALHRAEFLRFGSIHRNTYIDAPSRLGPHLELRDRPNVRFAGLLTGVAVNLILAILCFAWYFSPAAEAEEQKLMSGVLGQVQSDLIAAPNWLCLALGALLLLNVLLLVVVYFWQSWGVIGLIVVPIAAAVAVNNGGLGSTYTVATLVLLLLPVIPLIALLLSGPRPTMWEQMD